MQPQGKDIKVSFKRARFQSLDEKLKASVQARIQEFLGSGDRKRVEMVLCQELIIAERNGECVGFVSFDEEKNQFRMTDWFVRKDLQGMGIGKSLLNKMIAIARPSRKTVFIEDFLHPGSERFVKTIREHAQKKRAKPSRLFLEFLPESGALKSTDNGRVIFKQRRRGSLAR